MADLMCTAAALLLWEYLTIRTTRFFNNSLAGPSPAFGGAVFISSFIISTRLQFEISGSLFQQNQAENGGKRSSLTLVTDPIYQYFSSVVDVALLRTQTSLKTSLGKEQFVLREVLSICMMWKSLTTWDLESIAPVSLAVN